jgi:hypothetical protein
LSLLGPLPAILLIIYNPSTSRFCHFSPEDGDSMSLWNVGSYLQICTTPKPKTIPSSSSSSSSLWKHKSKILYYLSIKYWIVWLHKYDLLTVLKNFNTSTWTTIKQF